MSKSTELKEWYVNNFELFEKKLNGESKLPIHTLRKEAISSFSQLEFPTTADEEWRYTNISPLLKHNFVPVKEKSSLSKDDILKYIIDKDAKNLLVFVNGQYEAELSYIKDLPKGVFAGNLNDAINQIPDIVNKHYGNLANHNNHIFTALSAAFASEGAVIYVPDNVVAEEPVHILFLTDAQDEKYLIQPRNLIVTGKNSQITIVDHYISAGSAQIFFNNNVTEVICGENSFIDHIRVQEESTASFHFSRLEAEIERAGNFRSHFISIGSELTRNEFNSKFNAEGGECTLNGIYLTRGNQLFDAHTLIDHANPHCNSHEHYKGILDDRSRGVFNGKVLVRKDAQKTNAFQENNNIILSDDALVNTKPQLEIFADDVKCSHGATIGQLDMDQLFYLKTRGIGGEAAKAILIHAFASDVVQSVKVESVKNYVEDILTKRFDK